MTEGYKHFRSKTTGKAGYYPAHFGETWPDFEEVDPNSDFCADCAVQPTVEVEVEAEQSEPEPEVTPVPRPLPRPAKTPKESDK